MEQHIFIDIRKSQISYVNLQSIVSYVMVYLIYFFGSTTLIYSQKVTGFPGNPVTLRYNVIFVVYLINC